MLLGSLGPRGSMVVDYPYPSIYFDKKPWGPVTCWMFWHHSLAAERIYEYQTQVLLKEHPHCKIQSRNNGYAEAGVIGIERCPGVSPCVQFPQVYSLHRTSFIVVPQNRIPEAMWDFINTFQNQNCFLAYLQLKMTNVMVLHTERTANYLYMNFMHYNITWTNQPWLRVAGVYNHSFLFRF